MRNQFFPHLTSLRFTSRYGLPAAPSVQLHLSSLRVASSCRVCKTAQAPFSPVAPAAPSLQPPSFELPAAPSVSQLAARENFQLRRRSSQLPAAPSFKCQLPARHNVPASSFQLARAWKARERGRWAESGRPPTGGPGRRTPGRGLPYFLCVL